jgi:tetratricopeptide (TPR) repeat protein
MRARVHAGSATDRAASEGLAGEVLVAQRSFKEALPRLEAALRADSTAYTLESLAYATAASGALDRAVSLYRELALHPQFGWEGQEYWHMALYQLGRTEELRARADSAVSAYQQFVDLWRDADASFPPVADARERIARLQLRDMRR